MNKEGDITGGRDLGLVVGAAGEGGALDGTLPGPGREHEVGGKPGAQPRIDENGGGD